METGFTNKEMLKIMMKDIEEIKKMTYVTNGKVRMHTKILWSLGGAGICDHNGFNRLASEYIVKEEK